MEKNDRVSVSRGVTINLGHGSFESVRLDYSYETSVRDGEDENKAMRRANKFVFEVVDGEEQVIRNSLKKRGV